MGDSKAGQSDTKGVQVSDTGGTNRKSWPKGARVGDGTPGPGRPKGCKDKVRRQVKTIALDLLGDDEYQRNLAKRLRKGTLAPALEAMLWHYAFGKPVERMEIGGRDDFFKAVLAQASVGEGGG